MHYVCTPAQARALVAGRTRFWVEDCGCRVAKGKCARSRTDVCLMFSEDEASGPGRAREITPADAAAILREADEKKLVARPWRDAGRHETAGICFCCDDCCGYFLEPEEVCAKGDMVERTAPAGCNDCGNCIAVCYFGARRLAAGKVVVDGASCYGCGLCVAACPDACIEMVPCDKSRV